MLKQFNKSKTKTTMKKVFFSAAFMLLAASCSNDGSFDSSFNPSNEQVVAPVTVTTTTGFDISQGDFTGTRATAVGEYADIQVLTLVFYKPDGTQQYKCTHIKGDATTYETTFGEFSTSLPLGSYTMVVMGYNWNQELTLTSSTVASYGAGRAKDTFYAKQSVSITNTTAVNLTATLTRIVTALAVQSTDNRPAGVTHIRFTLSGGGTSFNPSTGFASSNTGFVVLINFTASVGSTVNPGDFFFLDTDEQTMDVTVETLDAADGNVVFSKTFANVPFKRNRQTTLRGPIFTDGSANAGSFLIQGDWITPMNTINF